MQWVQLLIWGALTITMARRPRMAKIFGVVISAGILLSMATQLWILHRVGLLSVHTGLPLHLCSAVGLLSIPMLLWRSHALFSFSALLGTPCAFLALCFPAVLQTEYQLAMNLAFFRLHVLILCAMLLLLLQGFPLPSDPRPTLLWGSVYMAFVSLCNRIMGTNYLFLSRAPLGTPLEILAAQGPLGYVLSLEMAAILVLTALCAFYAFLEKKRQSLKISA